MAKKPTPETVWAELNRGKQYNNSIDLYDNVKRNENFYIGNQWEGVNAPDLAPITVNILRRVVSYFVSMLVADDVAVSFTPTVDVQELTITPEGEEVNTVELNAAVWSHEVERVVEQCKIKSKSREIIRNAAVDGDGYLYLYYDTKARHIDATVLDNTCVLFGNPYSADIDKQPYILIEERQTLDRVRTDAKAYGVAQDEIDNIKPDGDTDQYDVSGSGGGDNLVTVVTRLWMQGGTVWAIRTTQDVVIRRAWDTGYTRYPVAAMQWERIKNCYHGQAALTGVIPNQILINQLFSLAAHSVKTTAFPRILYDMSRITRWTNKPGVAIGVQGPPGDAVAVPSRGADMSAQVTEIINELIQKTLEYMGASDAALGNVKPDNTSAIIATQKASSMPLELQRLAFHQFTEDYVRVMLDIMRADYGQRPVSVDVAGVRYTGVYDFDNVNPSGMDMRIDVGSSAYWSELMQIQTADNLFGKGIISDPITYLDSIPDQYIRGKNEIIRKLEEQMAAAQMPAMPGGDPSAMADPMAQMMQPQAQSLTPQADAALLG